VPTLLDIHEQLTGLDELLDQTGGELTPDVEAEISLWLDSLAIQLNEKTDAYVGLMRNLELTASALKAEQDRLAMRIKAKVRAIDSLRWRLDQFMQLQAIKTIDTGRFRVTRAANGGKAPLVFDTPPEHLPDEFVRIVRQTDGEALRAALDAGDPVAGEHAHYGERGTHLVIR